MVSLDNIYFIAKDMIESYLKRRITKTPLNIYFKGIEKKLKLKLSKEQKEKILMDLENKGIAQIITSKNGHKYIVFGDIY